MTEQKPDQRVDLMEQVRTLQTYPDPSLVGHNRHDRRALTKVRQRIQGAPAKPVLATVATLAPTAEIVENEDDILLFQKQLPLYEAAQSLGRRAILLCNIYQQFGLAEVARFILLGGKAEDIQTGRVTLPSVRITPQVSSKLTATLKNTFGKRPVTLAVVDEDDAILKGTLIDSDIPTKDILEEGLRARQETIELMKMHIAWLEERSQPQESQEGNENPAAVVPPTNLETITPSTPYTLAPWKLFWTTEPWSADPRSLVQLPTTSRAETLGALRKVGRHGISVKATSILNLLESHLQPDSLRIALAARLKHGPEEIRAWAKLKRGDDRIPLLIPEEQTAIFFVCGRDEIYDYLEKYR